MHARSRSAHTAAGLSDARTRGGAADHRRHTARHDAGRARRRHGGDRAADDRGRSRRHRQHVVGGDRESAQRHRRDAALRQALRHPRPAHHDDDRDRHLYGWLGSLRVRALDAGADLRPRAAGTRRRRPDAAGADHHRRRRLAARAAALSGLHLLDLHPVDRRRAADRRLHRRASALVVDLLGQRAALCPGVSAHLQRAEAAAAPRPSARARSAGRGADGGGGDRLDAGADLGRAALRLGLAAHSGAARWRRRCCGCCSRGGR